MPANMRLDGVSRRGVLLVTEVFPPDTGGSAQLFGNTYQRLPGMPVTVIRNAADGRASETADGPLRVINLAMTGGHWGLTSLPSLRRYRRIVGRLVSECRRQPTLIHCGRALPEGLAALCATRFTDSARYLCWALGEELTY